MDEQPYRVLILDSDPDTLITLQHLLEDAGVDATITWDEAEARQLVASEVFDLVLLGDHPPELNAALLLGAVSTHGASHPSLILRDKVLEKDLELFRGLGAVGVVPKRDPFVVLEEVRKVLAPRAPGLRRHPLAWPKPFRQAAS
ncbi:MAG TPA: response regulator [Terriglobales bacterium]|nr:response regulator [Terriglobales bacterium]